MSTETKNKNAQDEQNAPQTEGGQTTNEGASEAAHDHDDDCGCGTGQPLVLSTGLVVNEEYAEALDAKIDAVLERMGDDESETGLKTTNDLAKEIPNAFTAEEQELIVIQFVNAAFERAKNPLAALFGGGF